MKIITIISVHLILVPYLGQTHSQSWPFSQSSNNARKPRFSIFREFIEPLAGIFTDLFPILSNSDPIVETKNGFIQGLIKESRDQKMYYAFLGIPYAKPPVGRLRFEAPRKLTKRWDGVQSAAEYSAPCFHMDVFFSGRLVGEEDCLYANVYTPRLDGKLAVMVYIHGGGFSSGSGDFYQPSYLMDADPGIVLVIFNYRLSALGFLNTGDGLIRGNMALKDQSMMLKWVQENIANFGGDPNKVTLFGESAGAAMTQYHMLSPQSQGLFHRAIVLSGTVLSPWAFNAHPAASAKRLAKTAGCPTIPSTAMVACLKAVNVNRFKNEYKQMMRTIANPAEYFAPSAETVEKDDTFLTMHPREILKQGNYSKIPMLMGINDMEGLLYTSRFLVDPYAMQNLDLKFGSWIPRFLYYDPDNATVTDALKSYYFYNLTIDLMKGSHFLNLTNLLSDGTFVHPTHQFAKLYAKSGAPLHLYYNTHRGRLSVFDILSSVPLPDFSSNDDDHSVPELAVGGKIITDILRYQFTNEKPSSLGVSHGDLLFLLFNLRRVPGIGRLSMDYEMSKALIKAVADFANGKEGDTFRYYNLPWPVNKSPSDLTFMKIELPGEVISEPFQDRMRMWDNNINNGHV